ncbi:MAG: type IV toxin-antitoxin system AbiEi family antitoxin domain-containing protein [Candidatus Anstonellales archaeon]
MKSAQLYSTLLRNKLCVATTKDIYRMIENKGYARLFIHRLIKNGFMERVVKGVYALKDATILSVASLSSYPSYISCVSALSLLEKSDVVSIRIDVATLKNKRKVRFRGTELNFLKIRKNGFWGFEKKQDETGCPYYMAVPEKAFLDAVYFNTAPTSYLMDIFEQLDAKKLKEYAKRWNSRKLIKRLKECGFYG